MGRLLFTAVAVCMAAPLAFAQQLEGAAKTPRAQESAAIDSGKPASSSGAKASSAPSVAVKEGVEVVEAGPEGPKTCEEAGSEHHRECQDLQAQKDMAKWARLMYFVTASGIVVSGFVAVFVLLTFRQTKRTADAARDAVGVASDSAEKQLRAYINVVSAAAVWNKDEPPDCTVLPVRVQVNFKNSGNTPAHDVSSWMIVRNMWVNEPEFTHAIETTSRGVQGPGGIDHLEDLHPAEDFNNGVVEGWKKGLKCLFAFGEIRYVDAFGKPRFTRFRLVMPRAGMSDDGEGKFQYCREGNEAT